ncbi:MAG: helix-turn-helix domain-containing protein [bacterium]|nr:helix-turn-helix domain-containing protein [bacterium]
MSHDTFNGEVLRQRREELGFTVRAVSEETHIPVSCVEALESGDVTALPAPAYVAGFLKTYCGILEMAPEPLIASYETALHPPVSRFLRRQRKVAAPAARPAWVADVVAWAAVCAVIALGWVTYTVVVRPDAEPMQGQVEAGELHVPPVRDLASD